MAAQINFDWKKEADAQYERTKANWWNTGKDDKPSGTTIWFHAPLTGKAKKLFTFPPGES